MVYFSTPAVSSVSAGAVFFLCFVAAWSICFCARNSEELRRAAVKVLQAVDASQFSLQASERRLDRARDGRGRTEMGDRFCTSE